MIGYIGGKSTIGKWIKEFIPDEGIDNYIEPFGGMFWTYFNLSKKRIKGFNKIIYNDFNPVNANFINCALNPEKFYQVAKEIEYQKTERSLRGTEFKEKRKKYQKNVFDSQKRFLRNQPNYNWGAEYAYLLSHSYSGAKPKTSDYIQNTKYRSILNKLSGVNKNFIPKLKYISRVENLDFEKLILKYDDEKSFFYLDPPYFECEDYYSNHNFTNSTHGRLVKVMKEMKGKWVLSYYDFPQLSLWFPKDKYRWEEKVFQKTSVSSHKVFAKEILIMNY